MGRRKTKKRNIKNRIWRLKKFIRKHLPGTCLLAILLTGLWFMYTYLWGKSIGDNINCICVAIGTLLFMLTIYFPKQLGLRGLGINYRSLAVLIFVVGILMTGFSFISYLRVVSCILLPLFDIWGLLFLLFCWGFHNHEGTEPGEGAGPVILLMVLFFWCLIGCGFWAICLISSLSEYFQ